MSYLIIGNIVALIGSILMVWSGYLKEKRKILYIQTVQIGMFVISNIILGGISGAIINFISFIRNILSYKDKLDMKWKILITILSIGLTLYFNNKGLIGYLPLISMIIYVWYMNVKDVVKFKYLLIFTMLMWLVYDFYVMSYTSSCFDIVCIILNIVSIVEIKKNS